MNGTHSIIASAKDEKTMLMQVDPKSRTSDGKGLSCTVLVDTEKTCQTFGGFGGAITESAAYVLSLLPQEKQAQVLDAYFKPATQNGSNYTFVRTHVNSCDFSLENWACVEKEDETLMSFSMERPERYLIPLLTKAQQAKGSGLKLIVSPWSPPAWMKDNRDMNRGGHLLSQYRQLWADYITRYVSELARRNLQTAFVTVQNEAAANQSWDSCIWSATEEAQFAVQNLYPALKKAGFAQTGILVWDHNRDLLAERFAESMSVPGADECIAGAAYHWYSGDQYENVRAVAERFPQKQLVFSEGCVEGGPRDGAWFTGERYAHNIINDLNSGCTAWVDWNIALDMQGGPNHAGNNCDAPVLADTETGELHFQSSYYAIAQFSRYIEPGSRRLRSEMVAYMTPATVDGRMGDTMESTAFRTPGGKTVVVLTNRTEADMVYELKISGTHTGTYKAPPRSIQTHIFG